MQKFTFLLALASVTLATPAAATGGLNCRTSGARPIEVAVGFSHGFGASLILSRLLDNGNDVNVSATQWWLDSSEVRLVLISPDADRQELVLRATRKGAFYDGSVWRNGRKRWVRCREV